MSALVVALTGTFPYGSAELKRNSRKYLERAIIIAIVLHCAVIGGIKLGGIIAGSRADRIPSIRQIRVRTVPPPPSLSKMPPPPIAIATPTAVPPTVGVPTPVPDAQAPKEQTVAAQEEIRAFDPAREGESGSDDIVIAATEEDRAPLPGEFVYYEEEAVCISMPTPKYPEIARDAQIEGTVRVQALIGKDGLVEKAIIGKSVAMLDDSALEAVRHSKWKPAINNGKPTRQWVELPIRYTLH